MWAAYRANRANLRLRNCLVEHYLPGIHRMAAAIAQRMRLRDPENAAGEVLAALVACIVPDYDGQGDFLGWARLCIKRLLVSQRRKERLAESVFDAVPTEAGRALTFDEMPAREPRRNEAGFLEITAGLTDVQAAMLWLRFQRGASFKAIASALRMETPAVKVASFRAIESLKRKFR
jgi:DNA-directed RNA polymerase specialized sigma24 family protein